MQMVEVKGKLALSWVIKRTDVLLTVTINHPSVQPPVPYQLE